MYFILFFCGSINDNDISNSLKKIYSSLWFQPWRLKESRIDIDMCAINQ